MIKIASSILAADFAALKDQVQLAEEGGTDWFHLDVMDGHFVPNITFGPLMIEAMRKLTDLPLDVHLMIEDPDKYIQDFRAAGADRISVHLEATVHLNRTLNEIRNLGAGAGVALNPSTPASALEEVLDYVDSILVMTVNPGFGGQTFIQSSLEKLRRIAKMIDDGQHSIFIGVDGGIDPDTAGPVVKAGANVLVAGSAIFHATDITGALQLLRAAIKDATG